MSKSKDHVPHLSTSFLGLGAVALVAAALLCWTIISNDVREFESEVQSEVALKGGEALRLTFSRALEREWASLLSVADVVGGKPKAEVQDFMDAVTRAGQHIAWAGYAGVDGIVVAGSGSIWEGRDFSDYRWFKEGMRRPNIGGIYEVESDLFRTDRLINMSTPVRNEEGRHVGVAVYSVRMDWIVGYLQNTADKLGISIHVADREGALVVSGGPLASLATEISIQSDVSVVRQFQTDEGRVVAAKLPGLTDEGVSPLNWSLLVIVPATAAAQSGFGLTGRIWLAFITVICFVLIFAAFYSRAMLNPIRKLAETAAALADGKLQYPEESATSRESKMLSSSLARLQARLIDRQVQVVSLKTRLERSTDNPSPKPVTASEGALLSDMAILEAS